MAFAGPQNQRASPCQRRDQRPFWLSFAAGRKAFLDASRLLQVVVMIIFALCPQSTYAPGWVDERVGPSKYWTELDLHTNFLRVVNNTEKHVLVSLYGDQCKHCVKLAPTLETAAKKILNETTQMTFARMDLYRQGGPAKVARWLETNFPHYDDYHTDITAEKLTVPSMWLWYRQGTLVPDPLRIEEIPQKDMGFDGWKQLRSRLRVYSQYDYTGKPKDPFIDREKDKVEYQEKRVKELKKKEKRQKREAKKKEKAEQKAKEAEEQRLQEWAAKRAAKKQKKEL